MTEVQSIIDQVRSALPNKYNIHGFGIKKRELNNPDAISVLDSVDTAAWNYGQRMAAETQEDTRNTWVENITGYQSYRDRLETVFASQGASSGLAVGSLNDFMTDPSVSAGSAGFPLLECRCGSIVDFNAIRDNEAFRAVSGVPCRNCEQSVLNAEMAAKGLLCGLGTPHENHHQLCPHEY